MEQQRTVWIVVSTVIMVVLAVFSVMAIQAVNRNQNNQVISPIEDVPAVSYTPKEAVEVTVDLPPLTVGHYALWADFKNGQRLSLRQFRVNTQGFMTDLDGNALNSIVPVTGRDMTDATYFFITVEEGSQVKDSPDSTIILISDQATKNTWPLNFPYSFNDLAGSYLLATPSNGEKTNELSGVWFIKVVNGVENPSLTLPTAPTGWQYQGWIQFHANLLPTGTFTVPSGKDSFSNFSGPRSFPNFPGEDFLTNAPEDLLHDFPLNLTDGTAKLTVSLEPVLAASNNQIDLPDVPFIKLLESDIPTDAQDHTDLPLTKAILKLNGEVKVLLK